VKVERTKIGCNELNNLPILPATKKLNKRLNSKARLPLSKFKQKIFNLDKKKTNHQSHPKQ